MPKIRFGDDFQALSGKTANWPEAGLRLVVVAGGVGLAVSAWWCGVCRFRGIPAGRSACGRV